MRYEWDYALLPTEFPIGHSITNPTEAWILPASDSYFRRCRIPGDRKSSDFDRFSAMLQSLDRMTGNPDAEYWKSKMQALPTRSEDPATLWSAAADPCRKDARRSVSRRNEGTLAAVPLVPSASVPSVSRHRSQPDRRCGLRREPFRLGRTSHRTNGRARFADRRSAPLFALGL